MLLDERDKLLVEAARFYPGATDREVARQLRIALVRYRAGRWRRDPRRGAVPGAAPGQVGAGVVVPVENARREVLAQA